MIATILVLKPTVFTKVKENLGIRIAKCFRVLETLLIEEKRIASGRPRRFVLLVNANVVQLCSKHGCGSE